MAPALHHFVWCDLSAYRPSSATEFYAKLFGWRFDPADASGYRVARAAGAEVAGVFPMPRNFIDIGMPSFWMSYVRVEDVVKTLKIARAHGGRVEIEASDDGAGGSFGLIRDPLGAGFSILDGPVGARAMGHGARLGHELHISDAAAVTPFYGALFGWRIDATPDAPGRRALRDRDGVEIGAVVEASDAARGGFQYWAVYFNVDDLTAAESALKTLGGAVITRYGGAILANDPNGAAFFIAQGDRVSE